MRRVYVAGAYSSDTTIGTLTNIRKGMRLATEVMLAGYATFCPWFDHQVVFQLRDGEELDKEHYQQQSIAWLEVCHAVLLVPGWENSGGTNREIAIAEGLCMPIFESLEELKGHFNAMEE